MKTSTSDAKHGIQWIGRMQLDDSEFTDDLALLSYTHQQIQMKTASVSPASSSVDLNIHKGKSKILEYNMENTDPITLGGGALEEVDSFTYLVSSIIDEQRRSDAGVKARIDKVRIAFLHLRNICNSKQLSTNIKVIIFNKNVKTVSSTVRD
ncbi:unnamed protein product [Schistosoma margrebowiei]|uniref:Uncharacterized protein n=1 Tax=Schistosoma margrebowiei TaxID=48269 RepID=A0A183N6H8_9TREM|nr:unnamed protein product [Schistosoma margrebowiei]